MDVLTKEQRSYCMSRIRKKDTTPELVVRGVVHKLGYRFRLHRNDLAGCPDIVLPRHKRRKPKSNLAYWLPKLEGNKKRHRNNCRLLRAKGWAILTLWECWTRDAGKLPERIETFLHEQE